MKTLLVFLGASGTGKSTIRRELCGEPRKTSNSESTKVTLYKDKQYAVVGRHQDGSECVRSFHKLRSSISLAFMFRPVVIIDTVRVSKTWYKNVLERHKEKLIVVYFNTSYKENLRRLRERRGLKPHTPLPESTIRGNKSDRKRSREAYESLLCRGLEIIIVHDPMSKERLLTKIKRAIERRSVWSTM